MFLSGGNMASLYKTIERFDKACRILACSNKTLHDRVEEAISELSFLEEKDFNPDLRKGFRQVVDKISAYRANQASVDIQSATALSILEMCIKIHRETME
jgi:hypothetical protein